MKKKCSLLILLSSLLLTDIAIAEALEQKILDKLIQAPQINNIDLSRSEVVVGDHLLKMTLDAEIFYKSGAKASMFDLKVGQWIYFETDRQSGAINKIWILPGKPVFSNHRE